MKLESFYIGIKVEEETLMLQNDLHKLYKLAGVNNVKLNANKFELLRYGKEQEIKSATTYKSNCHRKISSGMLKTIQAQRYLS